MSIFPLKHISIADQLASTVDNASPIEWDDNKSILPKHLQHITHVDSMSPDALKRLQTLHTIGKNIKSGKCSLLVNNYGNIAFNKPKSVFYKNCASIRLDIPVEIARLFKRIAIPSNTNKRITVNTICNIIGKLSTDAHEHYVVKESDEEFESHQSWSYHKSLEGDYHAEYVLSQAILLQAGYITINTTRAFNEYGSKCTSYKLTDKGLNMISSTQLTKLTTYRHIDAKGVTNQPTTRVITKGLGKNGFVSKGARPMVASQRYGALKPVLRQGKKGITSISHIYVGATDQKFDNYVVDEGVLKFKHPETGKIYRGNCWSSRRQSRITHKMH